MQHVQGKRILIIGGTGSLGTTLCRLWAQQNEKVCIFSRDENKQWLMRQTYPDLDYIIGDMRDKASVVRALLRFRPNVVIIAAALKHIDICENNTNECIATNITGVNNVLEAVGEASGIETCLFISTDKACSPVNIYGMCKSVSERCVAAAAQLYPATKFVMVRYGNVICSRGSLIPKMREMVTTMSELPITDVKMTRFFMPLEHAVELISTAILHGRSGETFLPHIQAFRIMDVFKWWSDKYDKPIKVVGHRQGEKVHEMLINETERLRTEVHVINNKVWYIILPTHMQSTVDPSKVPAFKDFESSNVEDTIEALVPYFME